jgi:predicted metal-dependent hydrolase
MVGAPHGRPEKTEIKPVLSPEHEQKFQHGIELFNKREFFDCHEVLEEVWKHQPEPERQLTQGIIQIAVAYYHALRGNSAGAIKLLARGIPRVKPFLPFASGLELKNFLDIVEEDFVSIRTGKDATELLIPSIDAGP